MTLSRFFSNQRTCCIVCISILSIVIIFCKWILPDSTEDIHTAQHALNILNSAESNASWILTFSNRTIASSLSIHSAKKRVNVTQIDRVLRSQSSYSIKKNINSKVGLGKVFQVINYNHDHLFSQNISTLPDVKRDSGVTQQPAETEQTVRKTVRADVFVSEGDNNHDLSPQQIIRDISMKSSASGLVNVVAMSLYGSQIHYIAGVIRNAYLVRQNFPGWQLWVYIESPSSSKYPAVPEDVISRLVRVGVEVHYISPEDDMIPPMMWRFLVADDAGVDWFIVRDADSRLTQRDAAAVAAWMQSDHIFHCIRDHPSHAAYAVSGGLWGGRAPPLRLILRKSWATMMHGVAAGYLNDMNFLNTIIWPRVERHAYCLDSVSCDHWPSAFPFPVVRKGYEHVGQVYDEHERPRNSDVQILKHTLENRHCIPVS